MYPLLILHMNRRMFGSRRYLGMQTAKCQRHEVSLIKSSVDKKYNERNKWKMIREKTRLISALIICLSGKYRVRRTIRVDNKATTKPVSAHPSTMSFYWRLSAVIRNELSKEGCNLEFGSPVELKTVCGFEQPLFFDYIYGFSFLNCRKIF